MKQSEIPSSSNRRSKVLILIAVFLIVGMLIGIGIGAALFYQQGQVVINVPGEPRDLWAAPGIDNVTLHWGAPVNNGGSPITEYRIYRVLDSTSSLLASVSGDRLGYTDTTDIPGTTYSYYVKAINNVGAGPNSVPITASGIVQLTPTGLFIGDPTPVNDGDQLTFGTFTPITNFTDCGVQIMVNGMSSTLQSIVFPGNVFTAPSAVAIRWKDLGADGAISLGDYLTITGGTPNSPLPLPGGSYSVNIIFIRTGWIICSQTWVEPSEQTPIGSFIGTPTNHTSGYKLQFGVIMPSSTTWNSCKFSLFGTAASSLSPAAITMASGTATITVAMGTIGAKTYTVVITDLAADGKISQGDYIVVTSSAGFAAGSYTLDLLFTSSGGVICAQSWTV